jgi:hypothetical protein
VNPINPAARAGFAAILPGTTPAADVDRGCTRVDDRPPPQRDLHAWLQKMFAPDVNNFKRSPKR